MFISFLPRILSLCVWVCLFVLNIIAFVGVLYNNMRVYNECKLPVLVLFKYVWVYISVFYDRQHHNLHTNSYIETHIYTHAKLLQHNALA